MISLRSDPCDVNMLPILFTQITTNAAILALKICIIYDGAHHLREYILNLLLGVFREVLILFSSIDSPRLHC